MGGFVPGWYVDPVDEQSVRYWDGEFWTPWHGPLQFPVNWPARIGLALAAVSLLLAAAQAGTSSTEGLLLPDPWFLASLLVIFMGLFGFGSKFGHGGGRIAMGAIVLGLVGFGISPFLMGSLGGSYEYEYEAGSGSGAEYEAEEPPVVTHEEPEGWRSVQFRNVRFALPSTWGFASIKGGGVKLHDLDLPARLEDNIGDGLVDDDWDLVLIDQASVARLKDIPESQRVGAWRQEAIADLWIELDPDTEPWTEEEMVELVRDGVEDDELDVIIDVFDHPSAPGAFEEFWDGTDWRCRWYELSIVPVYIYAHTCRNPDGPSPDFETVEAILRTFGSE